MARFDHGVASRATVHLPAVLDKAFARLVIATWIPSVLILGLACNSLLLNKLAAAALTQWRLLRCG